MGKKSKSKKKSKTSEQVVVVDKTLLKEDRFDVSKPQFRQPKQKESKVVLDERFSSVLSDPRFQLDVKDKYGRKQKKKRAKEELSVFYTVQEGKDEEQEAVADGDDDEDRHSNADESSSSSSNEQPQEKEQEEDPASRIAYLTALSRGELDVSSSSDDESDNDNDTLRDNQDESSDEGDSDDDEDPIHGSAGILDPSIKEEEEQVELTFEESRYLAVMNMEWTHIRAVDIFAIVASFTPPGSVKRVQVFPSDFGMERMDKEDQFGPDDLWKKKKKGCEEEGDGNHDPIQELEDDSVDEDDSDSHSEGDEESSDKDDNRSVSERSYSDSEDADKAKEEFVESDFDPEKLRAYEASKLKYYFAIVEFSSPQNADKAYKEIDGMEFEHSSAAVDMRSIPAQDLQNIIKDRPLRDEATSIPSNYEVPEFIVSALQQTSVHCSWEAGDRERELNLTKYASGLAWREMAESDDLRAYLASDVSSDEEEEEEANEKGANLRKMLGLDSDDEGENEKKDDNASESESEAERDYKGSYSESEEEGVDQSKEISFVPGKKSLEDKIRFKLDGKDHDRELTPWEKYQEKRKQKRRERRNAVREKKKELKGTRENGSKNKAGRSIVERDSFFVDDDMEDESKKKKEHSQAELELLMAGDVDNDEEKRDFDMRGLQRLEKNKDKKLRGSRKRKEAGRTANLSGTDFQIDVADDRFQAVLDGQDDRFGIDRADPNFKETPAMREILEEQTRRRKNKRQKKSKGEKEPSTSAQKDVSADVAAKASKPTGGAAALSALVKSLKNKVQQ